MDTTRYTVVDSHGQGDRETFDSWSAADRRASWLQARTRRLYVVKVL